MGDNLQEILEKVQGKKFNCVDGSNYFIVRNIMPGPADELIYEIETHSKRDGSLLSVSNRQIEIFTYEEYASSQS